MVCYKGGKNIFMKHLPDDICICDNEYAMTYCIDDYSIGFKCITDYEGD